MVMEIGVRGNGELLLNVSRDSLRGGENVLKILGYFWFGVFVCV